METKRTIQQKRAFLIERSKGLEQAKKVGRIQTVNQGLKEAYAQEGHVELKTLKQWNAEGKRVKKGESALMLWGKPQKINLSDQPNQKEQNEEAKEWDFYPICFVFSNLQVQSVEEQNKQLNA